ncbi:MAG: SIS domain-containing protein [Emcibacteraceae bacterium]|nr:SIS domain-containing protein [Emcibacteraceae bacterium]
MTQSNSYMFGEIREIPEIIDRLIKDSSVLIKGVSEDIKKQKPSVITTIARGSSDHAALYLKYAIELTAGVPVASVGPSIASIYNKKLQLDNAVNISISQSGKSPDIVKMTEMARSSGALSVAITNNVKSPLSTVSNHSIDICAGAEKSVAATKTFVASIVAGLLLLAYWQDDEELMQAINDLPALVRKAIDCDWSILIDRLKHEQSIYILGRGPSMAISNEAALKFKETCQIHAESYSSAEVMHGPKSIVDNSFPVLALASRDESESSLIEVAESLIEQGADVYMTSVKDTAASKLPFVSSGHPLTDPLLLIISYYGFIENLAKAKGLNPDQPPHLMKITETN